MSSKPMQRAGVDGVELELEVTGTGEPVLLIHGGWIAEAYAPLCAEPALNSRYRLVRDHRRGYGGSSPVGSPFSLGQQAADCRALLEHLRIVPTSSATPRAGTSPCSWRSTRRRSSTDGGRSDAAPPRLKRRRWAD